MNREDKKTKLSVSSRGGVEQTRLKAKDTKKSKAKDSPSKNKHSRGQEQEFRGRGQAPRTQTQVFSKIYIYLQKHFQAIPKQRSSKKFFRRSQKKGLQKNLSTNLQNLTIQKNSIFEPRTGQFLRT